MGLLEMCKKVIGESSNVAPKLKRKDNTKGKKKNNEFNQISMFDLFQPVETEKKLEIKNNNTDKYRNKIQIQSTIFPAVKNVAKKIINDTFDLLLSRENMGKSKTDRFNDNINALNLLNEIKSANRQATAKEQSVLAKYVGWGGLAEKFTEGSSSDTTLKNLLGESYDSAKASTLTSFYTPSMIIKFIYKVITKLGFEKGRILDPSAGIGRFFGFMPEEMFYNSKLVGIEMDKTSAEICSQLYQSAEIINNRLERTNLKDGSFDLVISNIPFGDIHPYDTVDKELNKGLLIHDYYFIKAIKKVRNNGLIVFITSSGTMDKADNKVRRMIAEQCRLIGAVRLPRGTFKDTEVVSDIIFLQKTTSHSVINNFINISDKDEFKINEYFKYHPKMMLGNLKFVSSQFGPKQILECDKEIKAQDLEKLLKYFPSEIYETPLDDSYMYEKEELIEAPRELKEGEFTIVEDKIYQKQGINLIPSNYTGVRKDKLYKFIQIKEAVKELITEQVAACDDNTLHELQERLNTVYDDFVNMYGYINNKKNLKIFREDTLYPLVASLEKMDLDNKEYYKADIFTKRTIGIVEKEIEPETIEDAVKLSFNNRGCLDVPYMAGILKVSQELIKTQLFEKKLAFEDPETKEVVYKDFYLSGYTKDKLKKAELYSKDDKKYLVNVEELKKHQPEYVTDVFFTISSTWIPLDVKKNFLIKTLRLNEKNLTFIYKESEGYVIRYNGYIDSALNGIEWGTKRRYGIEIAAATFNSIDCIVKDTVWEDGKEKHVKNIEETQLAMNMQEKWKMAFNEYITNNTKLYKEMLDLYNEKFVDYKEMEYNNILTNLQINPNIKLRKHQLRAASRIIISGKNVLLCHQVGTGKTYTMVTAAQESIRIAKMCGKPCKNLFVIPNSLCQSGQFAKDYLTLYPQANILATSSKDFTKSNRRRILAKMVTCNWDAIIIPQSVLGLIPLRPETEEKLLKEDLKELELTIDFYKNTDTYDFSIKKLEGMKENMENRISKLNDMHHDEGLVYFEDLGITQMFFDEAHYYKNLMISSKMRVSGVSNQSAKKTQDLYNKIRVHRMKFGEKGIIFATATPVSNSMCEMYTMSRYLQYEELKKHDIAAFDSWASVYGEVVTSMEIDPTGRNFRFNKRFSRFCNVPELVTMFRQVADVVNTSDVKDIELPKMVTGRQIIRNIEPTKEMSEYISTLVDRAEAISKKQVKPDEDNMLLVTNCGRAVAVSPKLVDVDGDSPKINTAVEDIVKVYQQYPGTTELVFCDLGTPTGKSYCVYKEIKDKLIEKGIEENQIAFIQEANTADKRQELINKFNDAKIRILIGSSSTCSEGLNIQKHLKAEFHIDCPWKPANIAQREGRILRQGNMNDEVYIFRYVVRGSFDAYSWQTIEIKAKYIDQILSNATATRNVEDIDVQLMSYAETKACACSDERVMELCRINQSVQQLQLKKKAYNNKKVSALNGEDYCKEAIETMRKNIERIDKDLELYTEEEKFKIVLNEKEYTDEILAIEELSKIKESEIVGKIGEYNGLPIEVIKDENFYKEYKTKIGVNYEHLFKAKEYPKLYLNQIKNYKEDLNSLKQELIDKVKIRTEELSGYRRFLEISEFPENTELLHLQQRKAELENELSVGKEKVS